MNRKRINKLISVFLITILILSDVAGRCMVKAQESNDKAEILSGLTQYSRAMDLYQKAEELKTPLAIYNYLRNNINYEYYTGMRKGATGTFDSMGGNDVDQAALLKEMLSAVGIQSRYITGTIRLEISEACALTGAEDPAVAADILAMTGYETTILKDTEGTPLYIETEHTWLEAEVPYTEYRGAGSATGENIWIPLDTSIKKYSDNNSLGDYYRQNGLDKTDLTGITAEQAEEQIKELAEKLQETIEEGSEIYLNSKSIIREELPYLPLSLRYEVVAEEKSETEWSGECDSITITLAGSTAVEIKSPDLYSSRLTITYEGNKAENNDVTAVLKLNGKELARGESVPYAGKQTVTITIQTNGTTKTIENTITAGGAHAIITDPQTITAKELAKAGEAVSALADTVKAENVLTDEYLGTYLDYVGKLYFAHVDITDHMLADLAQVAASRTLSLGMTGYNVAATPEGTEQIGMLYIDIDYDSHKAAGSAEAEKLFSLAGGMYSSLYESVIWEEITGIPSVSTMSLFYEAVSGEDRIIALTAENYAMMEKQLDIDSEIKEDILNELGKGKMVIIPEEMQGIYDWEGTGYMVLDPGDNTCAYMISGGLNGGSLGFWARISYVANLICDFLDTIGGLKLMLLAADLIIIGNPITLIAGLIVETAGMLVMYSSVAGIDYSIELIEKYEEGDDLAGLELVLYAGINIGTTVLFTGGALATEAVVKQSAKKYLTSVIGEETTEKLLKEASATAQNTLVKNIKAAQKAGMTDEVIAELAEKLTKDQLDKTCKLMGKGVASDIAEAFARNSEILDSYSIKQLKIFGKTAKTAEEITALIKDYGDDFLKLYETYGDDIADVLKVCAREGAEDAGILRKQLIADIDLYGEKFIEAYVKYEDEFAALYKEYGHDFAEAAIKHQDEFFEVLEQYGKEAAEAVMKYGDDALECIAVNKDAFVKFYKYWMDGSKIDMDVYGAEIIRLYTRHKEPFFSHLKIYNEHIIEYYTRYNLAENGIIAEIAERLTKEHDTAMLKEMKAMVKLADDGKLISDVKALTVGISAKKPDIVGSACNSMREYNPTIADYRTREEVEAICKEMYDEAYASLTGSEGAKLNKKQCEELMGHQYKTYYRSTCTDEYIDEFYEHMIAAGDERFMNVDTAAVKEEMKKLVQAVEATRDLAAKIGGLTSSEIGRDFMESSFRTWTVDNCAEFWTCRNLILRGVKFDDIFIRSYDDAGNVKRCCRNCILTFFGRYNITVK